MSKVKLFFNESQWFFDESNSLVCLRHCFAVLIFLYGDIVVKEWALKIMGQDRLKKVSTRMGGLKRSTQDGLVLLISSFHFRIKPT